MKPNNEAVLRDAILGAITVLNGASAPDYRINESKRKLNDALAATATVKVTDDAGALRAQWDAVDQEIGGKCMHLAAFDDGINCRAAATATVAKDGELIDRHGRMTDALRDAITGMSVSIDVSTGEHDSERRLFGVVNEVMDCDGDKHGVTLLVYDTEANFATPKPDTSAPADSSSAAPSKALSRVRIIVDEAMAWAYTCGIEGKQESYDSTRQDVRDKLRAALAAPSPTGESLSARDEGDAELAIRVDVHDEALEMAAEIADCWDTSAPDGWQIAAAIRAHKSFPTVPGEPT